LAVAAPLIPLLDGEKPKVVKASLKNPRHVASVMAIAGMFAGAKTSADVFIKSDNKKEEYKKKLLFEGIAGAIIAPLTLKLIDWSLPDKPKPLTPKFYFWGTLIGAALLPLIRVFGARDKVN